MKEEEKIKALSSEALTDLGKKDITKIIIDEGHTELDKGDGWIGVANWKVRAIDMNDLSARIEFEVLAEESDEQVKRKIITYFSQASWE